MRFVLSICLVPLTIIPLCRCWVVFPVQSLVPAKEYTLPRNRPSLGAPILTPVRLSHVTTSCRLGGTDAFPYDKNDDDDESKDYHEPTKSSPIEQSMDKIPQWNTTRVPFYQKDERIDGKLAYVVTARGSKYGIAITFDHAVVIIVEERNKNAKDREDSTMRIIDPDRYHDDKETEELTEFMAVQVKELLGEEYSLHKTPQVLTMSGDVQQLIDNAVLDPRIRDKVIQSLEGGNEEEDEDRMLDDFFAFMRKELGSEVVSEVLDEEVTKADMKLLDDTKGELAYLKEYFETFKENYADGKDPHLISEEIGSQTGIKLLGFDFQDGSRSYSLVKLRQPWVLIGKYIDESSDEATVLLNEQRSGKSPELALDPSGKGPRFELLSEDERQRLLPAILEAYKIEIEGTGHLEGS